MNISKVNQQGIAGLVLVLLVAVTLSVGLIGAMVMNSHKTRSIVSTSMPHSYEECLKATGSKILLTSPEQCLTANGQTFTKLTGAPPVAAGSYVLEIPEWRLRLAVDDSVQAAYYNFDADGSMKISSKNLDDAVSKIGGCKAGFEGLYYIRTKSTNTSVGPSDIKSTNPSGGFQIGDYSYTRKKMMLMACATRDTPEIDIASQIQQKVVAALTSAVLY